MGEIRKRLLEMQDEKYRDFQCALMPTVEAGRVIGVRTPEVRTLARRLKDSSEAAEFMAQLPHFYYEENNLHAFLIEQISDYDACVAALNDFLPHVDNWATCDCMNPKVLGRHPERLEGQIGSWLQSEQTYAVRFGICMLMRHFLDEHFRPEHMAKLAELNGQDYYIRMAVAWYFATALAKQWDAAFEYIRNRKLSAWVHNKSIQKAVESRRISPERKEILKKYRISGRNGSYSEWDAHKL